MCSRWNAGQHDQARAAVEVAVDREQAVAHQADQIAEVPVAPGEVGGVGDGDVVVGRGPEHEHDVAVEQAQREDRAEALVGLEQHRQRFVGEAPRARQREARFAGREWNRGRALVAQVAQEHRERVAVEERRGTDERHELKPSARLAGRPVRPIAPGGAGVSGTAAEGEATARATPWHTGSARTDSRDHLPRTARGRSSVG